jgi:hypothetical protein
MIHAHHCCQPAEIPQNNSNPDVRVDKKLFTEGKKNIFSKFCFIADLFRPIFFKGKTAYQLVLPLFNFIIKMQKFFFIMFDHIDS